MHRARGNSPSTSSLTAACSMKKALVVTLMVATVVLSDEDGQYRPNPSDDGQYIPDNSGQYIPDDSGRYFDDGTGRYKNDGTGKYKEILERYRNDAIRYRDNGKGINIGSQYTPKSRPKVAPSFSPNLVLIGNSEPKQIHTKSNEDDRRAKAYNLNNLDFNTFGNIPAGTSNNPNRHSVSERYSRPNYNKGKYDESGYRIIKQIGDVSADGYHWEYETENGITAEEIGQLANKGSEAEAMRSKGFFKYTGPDNVVYHITYTADENGFVPKGNHLPTPPPLPEALRKALENVSRKL